MASALPFHEARQNTAMRVSFSELEVLEVLQVVVFTFFLKDPPNRLAINLLNVVICLKYTRHLFSSIGKTILSTIRKTTFLFPPWSKLSMNKRPALFKPLRNHFLDRIASGNSSRNASYQIVSSNHLSRIARRVPMVSNPCQISAELNCTFDMVLPWILMTLNILWLPYLLGCWSKP